jgi:hypothetical protein
LGERGGHPPHYCRAQVNDGKFEDFNRTVICNKFPKLKNTDNLTQASDDILSTIEER